MLLNRLVHSANLPGILSPQVQNVDFKKYLGGKTNLLGDAEEILYVMKISNINSEVHVGQQWGRDLTKSTYNIGQTGLPAYKLSAYIEWSREEVAKFDKLNTGVSLPSMLADIAKQGINQRRHQGVLFGFDKSLKQGITANATASNLPADSGGATKLKEYDTAELNEFLISLARGVMDSTFGMARPVIVASSVRVINYLKTAIIPLLNSANANGVDSVGGLYNRVVSEWLGVGKVEFISDDLLKENTVDNKDTIMIIAPGLSPQEAVPQEDSQNLIGENNIPYNTMCDFGAGLIELTRPEDFGYFAQQFLQKMTPGATLRSEAVVTCAVEYGA